LARHKLEDGMALSNAERQRRYRKRLKAQAQLADRQCDPNELQELRDRVATLEAELARGGLKLSASDLADREALEADFMFPFPEDRSTLPRFMGWDRLDWARAPDPIVRYFGLMETVTAWREGLDECADELPEVHRVAKTTSPTPET
jgi:hypothetical protein